jgi:hypothetical protein
VQKGKNKYQVASVVYTDGGKNFTKKIMSFANPAVFATVKNAKSGEEYEVKAVKDGDYWNWASIEKVDGNASGAGTTKAAGANAGKVVGSNYETAEERKLRQMLIVKQSSIANALEFVKMAQADGITIQGVLDVAQEFVDFVYGTNETLEEMDDDIPY